MKINDLEQIIAHAARVGAVDLDALDEPEKISFARKWSSHFQAAVDGLDDGLVWQAIQRVKSRGKRVFRSGVGLWLTDREFKK